MRRTMLSALLAAGTALTLVGAPALADPVVVGYTTVDFEPANEEDAADGDATAAHDITVQGLVVDNLEPHDSDLDDGDACPSEGCDYALLAVDPAAIQASTASQSAGGVGCETRGYGVVDPSPQPRDVSGARLYTATGAVPERTVATEDEPGEPITPGVGLLCFAAPGNGLANSADDGPLSVTQPAPVVIVSGREAGRAAPATD